MQPIQVDNAGDSRLRFVFSDTVVSFSLAADTTFEDIARTLGALSDQRYGNPVAIDVILGSREGDFGSPHVVSTRTGTSS
jgi:hypothetical protein